MLNSVMLVGRLVEEIQDNEIKLAVNRSLKNEEGIYETDIIPVEVWGGILENAKNYLRKGDTVGIRGRIETRDDKIVVLAEKMTFLTSNKEILKENGVE